MPIPPSSRPLQPSHRPIGSRQLATPLYYIVKLRDGRPGVVMAADHTAVWVPRIDPHLAHRHDVFWWDRLMVALAPKAGFILYSEDHDTKSLEDPGRYLRRGYVYGAIDITWLKRAMDMSMDGWKKPELMTGETEKLLDWLLRLSKNAVAAFGKGKDTYEAAKLVKEKLLVHPEVKAVVYSGHKATLAQRDSVLGLPFPKRATAAGGGYERLSTGPTYDSVYVQRTYLKKQVLGEITARPHR